MATKLFRIWYTARFYGYMDIRATTEAIAIKKLYKLYVKGAITNIDKVEELQDETAS